jgi:hypothetical protein
MELKSLNQYGFTKIFAFSFLVTNVPSPARQTSVASTTSSEAPALAPSTSSAKPPSSAFQQSTSPETVVTGMHFKKLLRHILF